MSSGSNALVQLKKLQDLVPDIIKEVSYSELYGYDLSTLGDTEKGTLIRNRLLNKFLVANEFAVEASASQLKNTLKWRRDFNPLSAGFLEKHSEKFNKLGVITSVPIPKIPAAPTPVLATKPTADVGKKEAETKEEESADAKETKEGAEDAEPVEAAEEAETGKADEEEPTPVVAEPQPEEPEDDLRLITTWNLYGAVTNRQELFGDLDSFLRWRVGEMERGIALLDFTTWETSHMAQIHDYSNVSFFRLDSATSAGSKATIKIFQAYYPEFLSVKYFVNVPLVMSWLFAFSKLFVAKATVDKFKVISNGPDLAKAAGLWVPKQYGGDADSFADIAAAKISAPNPELVKKYDPAAAKAATEKPTPVVAAPLPEPEAAPEAPAEAVDATAVTKTAEPVTTQTNAPEPPKTDADPETVAAKVAEPKTAEPALEAEPGAAAKEVEPKTEAAPATAAAKVAEPKTAEPATTTAAAALAANVTETVKEQAESKEAKPGAVAEAPKPTSTA